VTVPAAQVDALRTTVITAYRVKLEALLRTTARYLDDPTALAELQRHRHELWELDALVERVGWGRSAAEEPLEVEGPVALVHEAVHGALMGVADAFDSHVRERFPDVDVLEHELAELHELVHALRSVEEARTTA